MICDYYISMCDKALLFITEGCKVGMFQKASKRGVEGGILPFMQ